MKHQEPPSKNQRNLLAPHRRGPTGSAFHLDFSLSCSSDSYRRLSLNFSNMLYFWFRTCDGALKRAWAPLCAQAPSLGGYSCFMRFTFPRTAFLLTSNPRERSRGAHCCWVVLFLLGRWLIEKGSRLKTHSFAGSLAKETSSVVPFKRKAKAILSGLTWGWSLA